METKSWVNKGLIILGAAGALIAIIGGIMFLFDGFFPPEHNNMKAYIVGQTGLLIIILAIVIKGFTMLIEAFYDS